MEININTKFNIGDSVWALLYRWEAEDVFDKECRMNIYEKKISSIRYITYEDGSEYIQYFLEGMHSYEGENWFDEPDEYKVEENYYEQRLFLNKKDAERAYKHYLFINKLDKIDDMVDNLKTKEDGNE